MSDERSNVFLMSAPAEIAFPPALFEQRKANEKAAPRWELALLFEQNHPDVQRFKRMCVALAEEKQPGLTANPTAWKFPWSSGDAFVARQKAQGSKFDNDFMLGKILFNSHSIKHAPRLSVKVGNTGDPAVDIVDYFDPDIRLMVKNKFYAGCQVIAEFGFAFYPAGTTLPCVTAYVNSVLSLDRGKRRGGGEPGSSKYANVTGFYDTQTDPTVGMEPIY